MSRRRSAGGSSAEARLRRDAVGARVPPEVVDDVARVVGAAVTPVAHLLGGLNAGGLRVVVPGRADAVLKAEPRRHPQHLGEVLRAQRVVVHLRARRYPTPAWLAVGETATHVWSLVEHVDAQPLIQLTPSVVTQLLGVVELQAGLASEGHDHWAYAWRVVTGQEPVLAALSHGPPAVSAVVERALAACAGAPAPAAAPDAVHADLAPSNVLVRDGEVVAVVDVGNAGSGTRATDLTTLLWHSCEDALDAVRGRTWEVIIDVVGPRQAAVLTSARVLLELEWRGRLGTGALVAEAVVRSHRLLDELAALR